MLVLARRMGESLMIGDNIEVKLLSIDGDTVRIGIKAPKDVVILRKELYSQVAEVNRSAVEASSADIARFSDML
ncbi:MAG: carbon storage regulator CsrA [Bacillota bacterium]|jgi:carbon storage regulator